MNAYLSEIQNMFSYFSDTNIRHETKIRDEFAIASYLNNLFTIFPGIPLATIELGPGIICLHHLGSLNDLELMPEAFVNVVEKYVSQKQPVGASLTFVDYLHLAELNENKLKTAKSYVDYHPGYAIMKKVAFHSLLYPE